MRACRSCAHEKPLIEFVKSKAFKDGHDTICLECSRNKVKAWRKNNPEKRLVQLRREYDKTYNQRKHLKAKYGITEVDYSTMFNKQQGKCAICGIHQMELSKRLFVDHCHKTGKIRGLLCSHCNSTIGYARDQIEILESAIEYLRNHNG